MVAGDTCGVRLTVAELVAHVLEALRRFRARAVPLHQLSFGHTSIDLKEHLIRTGEKTGSPDTDTMWGPRLSSRTPKPDRPVQGFGKGPVGF